MKKFLCPILIAAALFPLAACGGRGGGRNRYAIEARFDPEAGALACTMTASIVNTSETAWDCLPFELYPNAYREGAAVSPVSELFAPAVCYDGESYGGIQIGSVTGASFAIGGKDENLLLCTLDAPLYPDERAELSMQFTVTVPKLNHRLGRGENVVTLSNFYPVLCPYGESGFEELLYTPLGDPFKSECADYELTLSLPDGWTGVGTNAALCGAGDRVLKVSAEDVRDVALVLGKELQSVKGEACGVPVEYVYFSDGDPDLTLNCAMESLAFYSETFGNYGYSRYTLVQTDLPYGGMEYPMLTMLSKDLKKETAPAVAHETAHQWWYALVGSDQYNEAWQDEGLAEFSAALFLENHPAYGKSYRGTVQASEQSYRAYFSVYSQVNGEADTRLSRSLESYAGEYEYRNLAYDKGLILFDRLRDTLGEKRLLSSLRGYARNYAGKIASCAEFISCLPSGAEELVRSFTEGRCVI